MHSVTSDPRDEALYLATNHSVLKTDLDGKNPVNALRYCSVYIPFAKLLSHVNIVLLRKVIITS